MNSSHESSHSEENKGSPVSHGADHGHAEPSVTAYVNVFIVLLVVTTVSFIANALVRSGTISEQASFMIILLVAVIKATLVAMFFMHLIVDWKRVYMLIVPALILGPMLVVVLLPDIVLAWTNLSR